MQFRSSSVIIWREFYVSIVIVLFVGILHLFELLFYMHNNIINLNKN